MSAGTADPARPVVLRQTGAVVVPVAVWLVCTLAIVDAVVEGTLGYALRVLIASGMVAFAVWMLLASPCLSIERGGLRIVNPLRVHWVPFGALDEVSVRGLTSVTVRHPSGRARSITSWNAPGLPRQFTTETAPVTAAIERAVAAWEDRPGKPAEGEVVATSWRWRAALVLVVLVAANISIWLR
jgi:hypothetical protein